MARPNETSNKKEIAKKKREKQIEKAEKKEQRLANSNKGKDLEDMIAYVDENGNLSSKPPDPRKKKEVNVEDISFSVAPHNLPVADKVKYGTVTFFDTGKGYGFIKEKDSNNSYFTHSNDLTEMISENDKVSFEIVRGKKGMQAVMVKKQPR
ncbi:DNA-binding protein [Taibaiella sp. KBW10]|uniref:cold-shock protein n=1 Tax=Taibaiella sp. KBW10 TaxID=2153357 RepID=UPI000F5B6C98|nr:cold shock domain-containing protein [Taibaiella sp. KBW10]RQO32555.1 DNA-binding protein [Taibaiella sp. KBW10]